MPPSSPSSCPCMRRGRAEPVESLPQSILEEVLGLFGSRVDGGDADADEFNDSHNPWKLRDIQEAKSAQQKVFILTLKKRKSQRTTNFNPTSKDLSSSNNGGLDRNGNNPELNTTPTTTQTWIDTLQWKGSHDAKLVLRIWKGGSRWWNMNRNEDPRILARAEIEGYGIAGRSMEIEIERREKRRGDCVTGLPNIPKVLHFWDGLSGDSVPQQPCWALFEYVGPDEDDQLVYNNREIMTGNDNQVDNPNPTTTTSHDNRHSKIQPSFQFRTIDRSHLNGMIKIRKEFGFDEPHPRWGRVPVDQALDYAKLILNQVLLPLHRSSRRLFWNQQQSLQDASIPSKSYAGMLGTYRKALKDMKTSSNFNGEESEGNRRIDSTASSLSEVDGDRRFAECLQRLGLALDLLEDQANTSIPPLDPVLVHMDLQPQNLIFCNSVANNSNNFVDYDDNHLHHRHSLPLPTVFSVLDWEDAAWADPRFDLILLCRKVCANREQADVIWSDYERALLDSDDGVKESDTAVVSTELGECVREQQRNQSLGSIELWLRLETVHSITTMLLQSMDLVNGGRNPWETKKDLWGKLQREFFRWNEYK